MKKPTLFGLEITLTCPQCHKECPMISYEPVKSDLPDSIREAWIYHMKMDACQPPGCDYCGGTDFQQAAGKHLIRDDCIKHLRKLVVDIYKRLPTTTVSFADSAGTTDTAP